MSQIVTASLSRDEARSLTDEVKQDAERLWRKLVELYDGKAHESLGYSSWGAYFKAEFGGSRTRGYELLNAGRVVESVRNSGLTVPANEAQANELVPLLDDPETLREAWQEASTNGTPTAAEVRVAVRQRIQPLIVDLRPEGLRETVTTIENLVRALIMVRSNETAQDVSECITQLEWASEEILRTLEILKGRSAG